MKQKLLLSLIGLVVSLCAQTQVGIGTNTPASSAKLDVSATDKGFLPPRVALSSSNSSSPISGQADTGLLIYNTATAADVTPGYYYWSGSGWKRLISPTEDSYPISVSNGGTGSTALTANRVLLGNGANPLQTVAPGISGNVLTSNGTTWESAAPITPTSFSSDITVNGKRIGRGTGNFAHNTVLGAEVLNSNTTGGYSTAIGSYALASNTTGYVNNALGFSALIANSTGAANTAIGYFALRANSTGDYNIGIGNYTGYNLTTGSNNVIIGGSSGGYLSTGNYNTLVGPYSSVEYGYGNIENATAIGYQASVNESNAIRLGNGNITKVSTTGKLISGAVTYPNTDGNSGQVLTTNGSGTPSWQNIATSGTVEIGGGSYGITTILGSSNFTADYTNSKLSYMQVGNIVFFSAIIGKFTMTGNQQQIFEFKPPIASSFANSWDATGTISAFSSASNCIVSGSVAANPVYNSSTQSYNFRLSFVLSNNAPATNMFVSVSGSYIIR